MKISRVVLVLGLALAALVGSVWVGPVLTAAVMSVIAVVFAYAWPFLMGIPAKRTISTVGAIFTVLAITSPLYAPQQFPMRYVPVFLGFGVAASFVVQLLRGTGQVRRMQSLMSLSAGLLLASSGAGWVAVSAFSRHFTSQEIIQQASRGQGAVICVAVSALVGALIPLIQPRILTSTPIVIVGIGIFFGVLTGLITELPLPAAIMVGGVTGALTASFISLTKDRPIAGTKRNVVAAGLSGVGILGSVAYFGASYL